MGRSATIFPLSGFRTIRPYHVDSLLRFPARHDVVVLDGNPLDDIGIVAGEGERVAYVLQRGKIVKAR